MIKIVVINVHIDSLDLHNSGKKVCRKETSSKLSSRLWRCTVYHTIDNDLFHLFIVSLLKRVFFSRLSTFIFFLFILVTLFYLTSLFLRSLMGQPLNIVNCERFSGVFKLDLIITNVDLNIDTFLATSCTVLCILKQLPYPSLRGAFLELMIKFIKSINDLGCKLIIEEFHCLLLYPLLERLCFSHLTRIFLID